MRRIRHAALGFALSGALAVVLSSSLYARAADARVTGPAAPAASSNSGTAPRASDAALNERVKSAVLAQQLSALVFAVEVENGVVTLHGTADTTSTREKAVRAAREVRGVKSVNNRISVLGVS